MLPKKLRDDPPLNRTPYIFISEVVCTDLIYVEIRDYYLKVFVIALPATTIMVPKNASKTVPNLALLSLRVLDMSLHIQVATPSITAPTIMSTCKSAVHSS